MKKFTKLLGIVLIIALVMSMGIMAWAEDGDDETETPTASITITKDKTYEGENQAYTYKAYKIFSTRTMTLLAQHGHRLTRMRRLNSHILLLMHLLHTSWQQATRGFPPFRA